MAKVQSTTAVRPQIKEMVSPGSDENFEKSLPASTAGSGEVAEVGEKPKRKRRTKEEILASRGEVAPEVDPNMSDPRYARIVRCGSPSLHRRMPHT